MRRRTSAGTPPRRGGGQHPVGRRSGRPAAPPRGDSGFTLIELMIVVVVIGILAAIAIPNFVAMQNRAMEGSVKANMHTIQMSVEDFSLLNDGIYPTSATATVPDGRTLAGVCPTGGFPKNPYTKFPSVVQFNSNPTSGNAGEIGLNPALPTSYIVKGNGSNGDTLKLTLTSGQ